MNLQQKGFRHQRGKNEKKKEEELCYVLILNHLPAACCEATWHQTLVMVSAFFFSEVNLLLWRWKTHVAEAFMVEIHHHLLPFYSAGSQDRQVSVKRCWQKKEKKSNRVRLVLTFFYYSRTKPLFSAPLCATVGMIAVIPPPLASHQPKCLNLIQSDAYIHKIRAEGFKAVFRLGDSL